MSLSAEEVVTRARGAFNTGRTKPVEFREQQLKNLLRLYEENAPRLAEVLKADLAKHKQESIAMEIAFNTSNIRNTLAELRKWIGPERPPKYFMNMSDEVASPLVPQDSRITIGRIVTLVFQYTISCHNLLETDINFVSYTGQKIVPLGKIIVNVNFNGDTHALILNVIERGGPPLLGRDFLQNLIWGLVNVELQTVFIYLIFYV
ncbi:hypothetical protein PPYR_04660 [Photinus pyralis]|uniref:Aldehyde dehydrogenase domain-containing protein n=1 Tax=Photinus pyralis TaxID=7054 RepID=A0A5N4AYR5_PHOPY|nr:hypothetical protein PPYR_04660 [Photinus pyralis]